MKMREIEDRVIKYLAKVRTPCTLYNLYLNKETEIQYEFIAEFRCKRGIKLRKVVVRKDTGELKGIVL